LFIVALVLVDARGAFRSGGVDRGVLLRLSGADAEMGTAGTFVEMRLVWVGGKYTSRSAAHSCSVAGQGGEAHMHAHTMAFTNRALVAWHVHLTIPYFQTIPASTLPCRISLQMP
jgi:hypothetical protein